MTNNTTEDPHDGDDPILSDSGPATVPDADANGATPTAGEEGTTDQDGGEDADTASGGAPE